MNITKELIDKIDHLLSFGLTKGIGNPIPGEMCVEALICSALGEPHSDKPSCVHPEVRQFKINLNDANWPSNIERAKGMSKLAKAQLGSININGKQFKDKIFIKIINQIIPLQLNLIPKNEVKHTEEDINLCLKAVSVEDGKAADNKLYTYYYYNYYNYYYNYYNYYNYYYYNYYNYEILCKIADIGVEVLKELKSPGCEWL